jgi:LacI family transcriptional regulator
MVSGARFIVMAPGRAEIFRKKRVSPMKSTMRDVSSAAGVSVATVSHVLNNTKYVTEGMRKKVLDAVETLQYKPNITARNFKMGKQKTIGFIVPDIANSFFSTLINEVERVVAKQDYMLIVVNTQERPEKEKKQLRKLSSGLVDGVIIASAFDDYTLLQESPPPNFPLLFLDRKLRNCGCDTIIISNYHAVYASVERLLEKGHTKIGCVTGYQHLSTLSERLQAFRDCLTDHRVPVRENLILQVDIVNKNIIPDLEDFFKLDMTAVLFLNNTLTMTGFDYLMNNNVFLNRAIDAVGYSDEIWHEYAVRHMDIINQPISDMGRIAGERILERIENPDLERNNIILQASLVYKGMN